MLSFGFYNSKGGDRKYDAEQFGAMFNGIIADGVFAHYKNALKVTAGDGNRELVVSSGRAWFNGTWTEVDDNGHSIYLMGSAVEKTYFVYLAVNKNSRKNSVAWYSSIMSNIPEKGLYFYLLAQVTIPGGVNKITEAMITDTRGSDLCPYVTGIMETVSFEDLVKRVCGENWQDWLGVYEAGITTGVQNAVRASSEALSEVKSLKAYSAESEAVSYTWAKFEAIATGGGGFEWATDSVHTELADPPMPVHLFRDLSYADLGAGFKPSITLGSPYKPDGETTTKPVPASTQAKVWKEYPYFWEGGGAYGTEVLRYDDLQRVIVTTAGVATEKYRYRVSRLVHLPVTYETGAYIGTVTADNSTAYPRDGYKDGYWYKRFAAKAEDVSFYYPGLSAKNVRDAIIEVVKTGGTGGGAAMSVIELEELPATGVSGVMYVVKKPGDSDAVEYLWLDRWEKIGGTGSGQNLNLDTTLTKSGEAADAKVTGDEIKRVEGLIPSIEGLAKEEDIPTKPEDIGAQPAGNYLTSAPVESVNGKTGKVTLSASDVAARPNTWMPTAQEVGALPTTYTPPNQTAEQVGADPKGTAASAVSGHNTNNESHNDIRQEIKAIREQLAAFLDVDEETLIELSELIARIVANQTSIEQLTTGKVNVSDIVNNLTTNVANKPLSAAQGVAIKTLIDGLSASLADYQPKGNYALESAVPTKVSQLQNDAKYLTAVTAAMITAALGYTPINPGLATLARHEDGLLYLFVDGKPVGSGVELPTGGIDGYVDADKNIVVRGLDEGVTYKFYFELADGSLVEGGELVYDNTVYYTVTNNLTNCANNNSATQVIEGESYSATITAKSGYTLKSVTVTMGGSPVTVSGGTINIANVTGNIVITAVAEEKVVTPSYTNLLPLAIDIDGSAYNGGKGYKSGYKISTSSGGESAQSGACVSGFIAVPSNSAVLRIANIELNNGEGINNIVFYDANKSKVYMIRDSVGGVLGGAGVTASNGMYSFRANYWLSDAPAFFRFSCGVISDETIVTANEEIV